MTTFKLKTMTVFAAILLGIVSAAFAAGTAAPLAFSGKKEVPPVTNKATGRSMIRVSNDGVVSGHITTSGLTGTWAHVHTGATGSSGAPITTLVKGAKWQWSIPAGAKLKAEKFQEYCIAGVYGYVHSKAQKDDAVRLQLGI